MSMRPGSFRPDELARDDTGIPDTERAASYAAARELERALGSDAIHPSPGFADRVMAAVAHEPAPRPTGFLGALRARHGLAGVVASFRAAWTVAAGGGGRPVRARGLALAYVLAVLLIGASLTGVAAFGTAGALGLLSPRATPGPSLLVPGPTPSPEPSSEASETPGSEEPGESAEPSGSPDSSESAEPGDSNGLVGSEGPGATGDDHGGATPRPTSSDDHGGGPSASPGSGEDSGGSGSATQSPKPSDPPKPSD